ncbi:MULTISPECIES: hypothetical protein [unclassified Nocardia]|uniref:hypothetical protein n=1 Tax=unclassified Nocardia TaxID=2637762 RepID=UPI001CE43E97|nr:MULTISPECIES: hypothetical protein [unclassified Nocardia]
MNRRRWLLPLVALPIATVTMLVIRIGMVRDRAGDWSGEQCVVGPYDPAERTYLYVVTVLMVLTAALAIYLLLKVRDRAVRITAAVVVAATVIGALYLVTVWGGMEYNNRPVPELPCPDRWERGN